MSRNIHLTFSWGHILMAIGVIFIAYMSFLGLTYLTDGRLLLTLGLSAAILLILTALFIGMQNLKASKTKFGKYIIYERILFFMAPFVFVVLMYPMSHFFSVLDNAGAIESSFDRTIKSSRTLFVDYEAYATLRIDKITPRRNRLKVSEENKVMALRLQLLGDNYQTLKQEADAWIDKVHSATVWNVFVIGNINTITGAIEYWNASLEVMSSVMLSYERGAKTFDDEQGNVEKVTAGFANVRKLYSERHFPNLTSWLLMLVLFFFMILPYIIQRRNTKSLYWILGKKKERSGLFEPSADSDKKKQSADSGSQPADNHKYSSFEID